MSDNAPENVDLDERFNQFNPVFVERALVLNMTATTRMLAKKSADRAMPLMLMGALGYKPTAQELEAALLDAYTALAMTVELTKLIDEIVPIAEVDDIEGDERKHEVRELFKEHPMILKAQKVIKELLEELTGSGR